MSLPYLCIAEVRLGEGRRGKYLEEIFLEALWYTHSLPERRVLATKPMQGVGTSLLPTTCSLWDEKHRRKLTPELLKETLLVLSLHMCMPPARSKFDTDTKEMISSSDVAHHFWSI